MNNFHYQLKVMHRSLSLQFIAVAKFFEWPDASMMTCSLIGTSISIIFIQSNNQYNVWHLQISSFYISKLRKFNILKLSQSFRTPKKTVLRSIRLNIAAVGLKTQEQELILMTARIYFKKLGFFYCITAVSCKRIPSQNLRLF